MRNATDSPCGRPATTELLGVPFCGHCAREQEDYFAIGELTRAPRGRRAGTAGLLGHAGDAVPRRPQEAPAERRRRYRETAATGAGKVPFLLVVLVLVSVLASAACGGPGQEARADSDATGAKAGREGKAKEGSQAAKALAGGGDAADRAVARAGAAEARARDAKAGTGDARARAGSTAVAGNVGEAAPDGNPDGGSAEGKDGREKVTLRITGDPGTRFSGACSLGGRERALGGRAPERYAFEPDGKKLECEVRKEGRGALGIVFADGEGVRSEQRTGAGRSTVGFVYSGGGIASSTSSSVSVQRAVTSSGGTSSDGSR